MRKISKLLIVLFTFAFGINIVNAADCDSLMLHSDGSFVREIEKMSWNSGGSTVSEGKIFNLKDSNGNIYNANCINPGKNAGANRGGSTFKCVNTVFDSSKKLVQTDLKNIYDAGAAYIAASNSSNAAKDLAMKTFELIAPDKINSNNGVNDNSEYSNVIKNFANRMINDPEVSKKLSSAYGSIHKLYNDTISYSWAGGNGSQIEQDAKNLIINGLGASINFKNNGAAYVAWNDIPTRENGTSIKNDAGVTNYSSSVSYTFDISNFKNNPMINAKVTCPNCGTNGVKYTVYVNNEKIGDNYTGEIDFLSKISNGTGKVILKIEFNGDSRNYSCEELDYAIELKYKDDTIANEVYDMRSLDNYQNGQNLRVVLGKGVTHTKKIESSIAMCTLTCKEMEANCKSKGASSSACTEFKKQYPTGCVDCGMGIVNNYCADPGKTSNLNLIEGYEYDSENCTQSNTENIVGCILDNKDAANNSYVDSSLGNSYCSVSCKEDFHFILPGNINVGSGRYFKLNTDLTATKTCYLNLKVNPDTIANTFVENANKTKELYNKCELSKALSSMEVTEENVTSSEYIVYWKHYKYSDLASCAKALQAAGTAEGLAYGTCGHKDYYSNDTGEIRYKGTYVVKEANGCSVTTETKNYDDTVNPKDLAATYAGACSDLKSMNTKSNKLTISDTSIKGSFNEATLIIGQSGDSIYNELGQLNSCANWTMNYNFDPTLKFQYEESYNNSLLTNEFDLVGEISKGSVTKYYCGTNDGDKEYKSCSSTWSNEPVYAPITACVCEEDKGCSSSTFAYNKTFRMKESIIYEASYITPTQFYSISPTGKIAVTRSGEGLNATEFTNGLPVGLGTPQGIYHYVIFAENLGEYFNEEPNHKKGSFGRVWGNRNSVVATTLKGTDECIKKGDLKYDTTLKVKSFDDPTKTDDLYIDEGIWECNYCVDCNYPQEKVCVKTDGTIVDMTSCLVNKSEEECKKELCNCPDCPPVTGYVCKKVNGKYYGKTGAEVDYKTFKIQCCPDGGCPVTLVGGKNFSYRPVSTGDLNPGKRTMGPNWYYDKDSISTALEMKAYVTTNEILLDGETIYDENSDKYVMKVKLDSAMINKVKSRADKDYASNTLECYDYTQDGKTYNNIFCYSKYIDELLSDPKTKEKITFAKERPLTESERKNSQNSEYWTTWTKSLANGRWDITTTKTLSYFSSNYGEINIGPSWK